MLTRLKYYLRIILRLTWKYKTRSMVGLFGLVFGLACLVPATYWLRYETCYDSAYPDADRLYRVYTYDKEAGKDNELVSGILSRELGERIPALANSTLFFIEPTDYKTASEPFVRLRTLFTDSTFLKVFPQRFIAGDAYAPLAVENQIVLTESVAKRLYGGAEAAVGQSLQSIGLTQSDPPYTVVAVVKDPPRATNLPFDAFLAHNQISLQKNYEDASGKAIWSFATLRMYARLPEGADPEELTERTRLFPAEAHANKELEVRLLPIKDERYHLNSDVPFTLGFIQLFVIAGLLLLASALFNFLNLHYGLLKLRAREFQLRATHGASRRQLIGQMLFEIGCLTLVALLFCGLIIVDACRLCSRVAGFEVETGETLLLFAQCGSGLLVIMLLAALPLVWRRASHAFGPQQATVNQQSDAQRIAVASQLAVSIVFLMATAVVSLQTRYVSQKDPGFDREGILSLVGLYPFLDDQTHTALRAELNALPQLVSITDTYFTPKQGATPSDLRTEVEWPGKTPDESPAFNVIPSDERFNEVFKAKLIDGRWLKRGTAREIVINEEARRAMGLENPIGMTINLPYMGKESDFRIVGVVGDCHLYSLRSRILPTLFYNSPFPTNTFYLRIANGQEQAAIRWLNERLPRIHPTFAAIEPTPLSVLYDRLGASERAGLRLFAVLAAVCLLVSLFGIYAIASSATRQRRKEIAIRKVFGARTEQIIALFFREFLLLTLLSGVIALPIAYAILLHWLRGYAYRIAIPWWLPIGVLALVAILVLLTVLGQVWKAANGNPAEVVKNE